MAVSIKLAFVDYESESESKTFSLYEFLKKNSNERFCNLEGKRRKFNGKIYSLSTDVFLRLNMRIGHCHFSNY